MENETNKPPTQVVLHKRTFHTRLEGHDSRVKYCLPWLLKQKVYDQSPAVPPDVARPNTFLQKNKPGEQRLSKKFTCARCAYPDGSVVYVTSNGAETKRFDSCSWDALLEAEHQLLALWHHCRCAEEEGIDPGTRGCFILMNPT